MQEQPDCLQKPLEIEQLPRGDYFVQVLNGVGVMTGLAVLWVMEIVRNKFFHLLDRLNVKPRRRSRASAFPPGRPRKHRTVMPASGQS